MEEKTKLIDKQKSAKEKTGHPVMGGRFNSNQYVKALVAFTKLILCKITLKTKNVKFFSPIMDIKKMWNPSKAPHFNKPTRNNLLKNQSLQKYNQKIQKSSQLSVFGYLIDLTRS